MLNAAANGVVTGLNTTSSSANLGPVGNITITGGSNGQVLTTNGSGALSWTTAAGGGNSTPAGSNTQVQYNNAGSLAGTTGLTYDVTTDATTIGNLIMNDFQESVAANVNTGTSITPDFNAATIFRYTANNNFTFNGFTNATAGKTAIVFIRQDATGNRLMTSTMKWAGGSKTLSTSPNSIDTIAVLYDGSDYYASLVKGYV